MLVFVNMEAQEKQKYVFNTFLVSKEEKLICRSSRTNKYFNVIKYNITTFLVNKTETIVRNFNIDIIYFKH